MKKLIFLILALIVSISFNSCNDDEPFYTDGKLFNQIAGQWEIVSEANEYYIDGKLIHSYVKYDFPHTPGMPGEEDTVYLTHLNFKYIGSVGWESNDGYELSYGFKWGVQDNKFWMSQQLYNAEEYTEVIKLTDTEFHFIYTSLGDSKFVSMNGQKEILTYKLKR